MKWIERKQKKKQGILNSGRITEKALVAKEDCSAFAAERPDC
jgi:hypothetical protein